MGRSKGDPRSDVASRSEGFGVKNPYSLLGLAIVCRAWMDYRILSRDARALYKYGVSKQELDEFFSGVWCETLLRNTSYDGEKIRRMTLCLN